MRRRTTLLICLVLPGCLPSLAARPSVAPAPTFDPVAFFTGHTHGEGVLEQRFVDGRRISVEGNGHANADGSFQLDQTITDASGAVEARRWILRRRDSTSWTARLSDASGDVTAESTGNLFHLRYQIRSPRVFMEQWLYLQPDGRSLLNFAEVTVLGIPYARLSETITRTDVATAPPPREE